MTGYPPIEDKGSYEIVSREGPVWKLRLFERKFQNQPTGETGFELRWAEDGASFIVGEDRYHRQKK